MKTPSEKAAETRKRKLETALAEMGEKPRPKPKKKRKPMTPEQKAIAVERLRLAREKKLAGKVKVDKSIHESIRDLDDDDDLSPKKVKEWIQHNKEKLQKISKLKNSKEFSERMEYQTLSTYVSNLEKYLRTGVYSDHMAGMEGDEKVYHICHAKAYDKNGFVKRNIGTWYSDVGLWTKEMDDFYKGVDRDE
jgi:hypothetical protein